MTLIYVGNGLQVRDVPGRDLTDEDIERLEDELHGMIEHTPYKSLKEFLLITRLYVERKAETHSDRENKILAGVHKNKMEV